MNPRHELRDGVMVVKPPRVYRLTMQHRDAARPTTADCENRHKLAELAEQMERLDYEWVELAPIALEEAST